jgi:hypothetical protein
MSMVTTRSGIDGRPDGRVVHGLEHVLDQLADVTVDRLHRLGDEPPLVSSVRISRSTMGAM